MMDKTKEPGIFFNGVLLQKCKFEVNQANIEGNHTDIKVNFRIDNRFSQDKKMLFTSFSINAGEEESAPFNLSATMTGIFSINEDNKNLDLDTFSRNNAPGLVFPYLREFISNLTLRAGINPPFTLPPMNIIKMMKEEKKDK